MQLPRHLRYLEQLLETPPGDLSDYFPQTAAGTLQPGEGEDLFCAMRGVCYVGSTNGIMVPIEAENLEEISGNTFDAEKFSTLVDAIQHGDIVLEPGYADIYLEDGQLKAQVRDGNHRTLAAIAAGASMSWVMLSDNVKQDIDQGRNDKTYRAIRAAQRAYGVPQLKKQTLSRVKSSPALETLREAEAEYIEIQQFLNEFHKSMLRRFGPLEEYGGSLERQLESAQVFWRLRAGELTKENGWDWILKLDEEEVSKKANRLAHRLSELNLYDKRRAAGLKHGERLDPATMKVIGLR